MAEIANKGTTEAPCKKNILHKHYSTVMQATRAPKRSINNNRNTATFQNYRRRIRHPRHPRPCEPSSPAEGTTELTTDYHPTPTTTMTTEQKRPRAELDIEDNYKSQGLSSSAPADYFRSSCSSGNSQDQGLRFSRNMNGAKNRFTCNADLLDRDLLVNLLWRELDFHPHNQCLYFVNPVVDDRVDATLRNDAIHNLRFVHNVFFSLTTHTFCKAINIIDRLITKVKVKPRYLACVATASYRLASKLTSDANGLLELPEAKTLVQITRCGGNEFDLERMENILINKLGPSLDNVNAYDFLLLFMQTIVGGAGADESGSHDDGVVLDGDEDEDLVPSLVSGGDDSSSKASDSGFDECSSLSSTSAAMTLTTTIASHQEAAVDDGEYSPPEVVDDEDGHHKHAFDYVPLTPTEKAISRLAKQLRTRIEMSLCSIEVYRYRPACLALAILAYSGIDGLDPLLQLVNLTWDEVNSCANLVEQLCDYESREVPRFGRSSVTYNACCRRFMRLGYSSPTPLDTIFEDYEPIEDCKVEYMTFELVEE